MSTTEQQPNQNNDVSQQGQVQHPLRIFLTAIFAFLIPLGALILILEYATNDLRTGGAARQLTHEAVAERIQPVARVLIDASSDDDAELKTGEEVYNMTCATCHKDGVAGAPKFADEAAWAPYIETGYDELLHVALNGKGAMPAKGGNTSLDDLEVERAMVYMANAAGADFDEPESGEGGADESEGDSAEAADAAADTDADSADESADSADNAADEGAAGDDEFAATAEQLEIGKQLYSTSCLACHATGIAGAPALGNAEAWQPYIETGLDTMLEVAINGKGAMPPRGASQATDEELKAAILYMVSESR